MDLVAKGPVASGLSETMQSRGDVRGIEDAAGFARPPRLAWLLWDSRVGVTVSEIGRAITP